MNLGIAFSGGGFRATLFHLGVVSFLRDAKLLSQITHITSVSGGSILAAHLVLNWDKYTSDDDEQFNEAADEIIKFVRADIRGRIFRRAPMYFPFRLIPGMRYLGKTPTDLLYKYYSKHLYNIPLENGKKSEATLLNLGSPNISGVRKRPKLFLLTTNIIKGRLWSFAKDGIYNVDVKSENSENLGTANSYILSKAVAASSAFPGLFPPIALTEKEIGISKQVLEDDPVYLSDGGVFDNLGIRKFHTILKSLNNESDTQGNGEIGRIIISDASATFKHGAKTGIFEPFRTSLRTVDILTNRVHDLEMEIADLKKNNKFHFIHIERKLRKSADTGNKNELIDMHALDSDLQRELPKIRTDLDKFSELEIFTLVRHGYCVARSVTKDGFDIDKSSLEKTPWDPLPKPQDNNVKIIKEDKSENLNKIRKLLANSSERKLRLFDLGDSIFIVHSFLFLLLIMLLLGYIALPFKFSIFNYSTGDPTTTQNLADQAPWIEWRDKIYKSVRNCGQDDICIASVLSENPFPNSNSKNTGEKLTNDLRAGTYLMQNESIKTMLDNRLGIKPNFLGTGFTLPLDADNYKFARVPEYLLPNLNDTDSGIWTWIIDPKELVSDETLKHLVQNRVPHKGTDIKNYLSNIEKRFNLEESMPAVVRISQFPLKKYERTLGRPGAKRVFAINLGSVWNMEIKDVARLSGHVITPVKAGEKEDEKELLFIWVFLPSHTENVVPATWGEIMPRIKDWMK